MTSKSEYIKTNCVLGVSEAGSGTSEFQVPPKTPVKKHPTQNQNNFYNTLSPLPFPRKMDNNHQAATYHFSEELRIVETPVPKEHTKLFPIAGEGYEINSEIIFESAEEDAGNNSSEESESDMEEEEAEEPIEAEPNPEEEEENSEEDSEEQNQDGQEPSSSNRQGERKPRRITKSRAVAALLKEGSGKKVFCNCKKTKCLKLYCDCFRLNQTCEGCNCVGCHNLDTYSQERNNAILALMDRNPDPFGQKIQADKHLKGCNCKKSNCLKKYCECYQAGLKCGQNCKCQQCKNTCVQKPKQPERGASSKLTAKKERRMVQI